MISFITSLKKWSRDRYQNNFHMHEIILGPSNYPHLLACKAPFNISVAIDWFNKSCADVGQRLKGKKCCVKTVETESISV